MSSAISIEPELEAPLDVYAPFWPVSTAVPAEPVSPHRAVELAALSGLVLMYVNNFPTEENVAAVLAWRPEAAPLVLEWREIWRRSFPLGIPPGIATHENESDADHLGRWFVDAGTRLRGAIGRNDLTKAASDAFWIAGRRDVETKLGTPGQRDWRCHVVDDAETMSSFRNAVPGEAFVRIGSWYLVLSRHDPDGLPVFALAEPIYEGGVSKSGLGARLRTKGRPYWHSEAFLAASGRKFAVAKSDVAAAMTLAAMARRGLRKAFLKGIGTKETWTVDLSSVRDAGDALVAYVGTTRPWTIPSEGVLIQEHMPFFKEQRFFVVGGRIVASVCSDRNHCVLDRGPDRILDERVAAIVVPEIGAGRYDRGVTRSETDRPLSAAFAREARRLVEALAGEGTVDYVLDMGLTERGILPIEINGLRSSGPYSLSRRRIVDARMRMRAAAKAAVVDAVRAGIAAKTFRMPAWPSGDDVVAAVAAMPLARIAAAIATDPSQTARRYGAPPRPGTTGLERLVRDVATELAAATHLHGDDRIGTAVDALSSAAFGMMPGCEPLFSLPFEATDGREPSIGSKPTRTGRTDEASLTAWRLCASALETQHGPILALVSAKVSQGGVVAAPLSPGARPWFRDDQGRWTLFTDDRRRRAVLSMEETPEGETWIIALDVAGVRAASMRLPRLRRDASGDPMLAAWTRVGGLSVPVETAAPKPSNDVFGISAETDPATYGVLMDEDGGFFDALEHAAKTSVFTNDPVGGRHPGLEVEAAGDRRRMMRMPLSRPSMTALGDDATEFALPWTRRLFCIPFELPRTDGEEAWKQGRLFVDRMASNEGFHIVVRASATCGDRSEVCTLDYFSSVEDVDRSLATAVLRTSDIADLVLIRTGGAEFRLRTGFGPAPATGRGARDPVLVVTATCVGGLVGFEERKLDRDVDGSFPSVRIVSDRVGSDAFAVVPCET